LVMMTAEHSNNHSFIWTGLEAQSSDVQNTNASIIGC